MASRPFKPRPRDPHELVLALCHDVGNLLAATRLSAYLIGRDSDGDQIRSSAEDIETLSTQAGAALAHVRPLLVDDRAARMHVDPVELLDAVERSLQRPSPCATAVEVRKPDDLPDVLVDAYALHHLLVTLVLCAWDASPETGRVQVSAQLVRKRVVFVVEDEGRAGAADKKDGQAGPRGRNLALEVAATLAERWGGDVRVVPREAGTRVELRLPPQ